MNQINQAADDKLQSTEDNNAVSKPAIINDQSSTENMEVHKHPHHITHKKKWGEYLLEFFMLFLAVFLGFVAENFREHQVEHQREAGVGVLIEAVETPLPLLLIDVDNLMQSRATEKNVTLLRA